MKLSLKILVISFALICIGTSGNSTCQVANCQSCEIVLLNAISVIQPITDKVNITVLSAK